MLAAAAAVLVPPNHEEKGILLLSISAIVLTKYVSFAMNIQIRSSHHKLAKLKATEHFFDKDTVSFSAR